MTPKFRSILYVVGLLAFGALTLLSTFKIIDPNTAANVSAALTAILGLFGITISGVAGHAVNRQIKNGAFDEISPADQVINGLDAVTAAAQNAQAEVQRVKDAVSNAVKDVPVLGPLAQQAIDSLPK